MKRALLVCLASGILAAGAGCCELWSVVRCRPIAICDPGPCCDAVAAPECGPACESECCPPCDPCGYTWGPLSWLFAIFTHGFCGDGCGELYWSDFHSEPPDCCDPCDRYGNWTGGSYTEGYCQSGQCGDGPPEEDLAGNPWSGYKPRVTSDYAPRVTSVTDRAVRPTPAGAASAAQAARPRPTPARR